MSTRLATPKDVETLVQLEHRFQQDELSDTERGEGMQGQSFGRNELTELVSHHWVVVAEREGEIVGYVIAGRWSFFRRWPVYNDLLRRMARLDYPGAKLSEKNTCQYGPVWIKKSCRGQGIFESLVSHIKKLVARESPYMLTFIAEDNAGSFAAHTRKASMSVIDFFTFDERDYYLLVSASN